MEGCVGAGEVYKVIQLLTDTFQTCALAWIAGWITVSVRRARLATPASGPRQRDGPQT